MHDKAARRYSMQAQATQVPGRIAEVACYVTKSAGLFNEAALIIAFIKTTFSNAHARNTLQNKDGSFDFCSLVLWNETYYRTVCPFQNICLDFRLL